MKCPHCDTKVSDLSRFCSNCGSRVKPDGNVSVLLTKTLQTPSKGVLIGITFAGRYRIIDELGRGGMGIVYKAEDLRLERFVALKFLPTELTQDESAKERFVREARAAAAVSHPNICTIYEIDEFEGQTFIAMEYVEGWSLRQITKKEPMPFSETLDLAIQITNGLEEAHKKGIIHRDIKSANIMLTENGQAKIMDFGLAKVGGSALITQEGVTMGTVAYMSPEQAKGEKVDFRTDIWSLGVVLYEMLSAQLPFWGEKEASILYSIEHREHKPVQAFNPTIPSELEDIVSRCLRKKPEARYRSASDMAADLRKYQDFLKAEESGFFNLKSLLRRIKQPKYAIPILIVFAALAYLAVQYLSQQEKNRWAREVLLPEVGRLVEEAKSFNTIDAFNRAVEAEEYLPDDPTLIDYFNQCSLHISFKTTPPGAKIFLKEYAKPDEEWAYMGISPLENLRVPYGYFRWKIEKEGYETIQAASPTFIFNYPKQKIVPYITHRTLDSEGSIPSGMVHVTGSNVLDDYFLDKYEVTNREYKDFMANGGYQKKEFWQHPFIKDGKTISWEEAMHEFLDRTGRPGPSTWEGGSFPSGQEEYPVSGVSWYEAAAYANYVGKSLPSISHWTFAAGYLAGNGFLSVLSPLSNYKEKGGMPVGSNPGIGFYGAYDMAGNVREWCWNEAPNGRAIRGGAWDDATYVIAHLIHAPEFDRSDKNGFRCVKYQDLEKIPKRVFGPQKRMEFPDYTKMTPVSDEVFASLKERYFYDESDLNIKIEKRDESSKYWNMEKVTFDAAYGNERTGACIFLPKGKDPPFQAVIYFPGAGEMFVESSDTLGESMRFQQNLEFILKNGRAVVYPIYKGFFERGNPDVYYTLIRDFGTYENAEYLSQVMKDFRRTLDYLETRSDIEMDKLAIFSFSFGIFAGTILPAIEERLSVNILLLAGLGAYFKPVIDRAEVNPVNFVGRVKIPTILLSGEHDSFFPLETSAKPLFDLLGTPGDQKHHLIYDTGHNIQKNIVVKDVLWFLDKYLGPVK